MTKFVGRSCNICGRLALLFEAYLASTSLCIIKRYLPSSVRTFIDGLWLKIRFIYVNRHRRSLESFVYILVMTSATGLYPIHMGCLVLAIIHIHNFRGMKVKEFII